MRVVFVLRSAEIFPALLRFVLPLLVIEAGTRSTWWIGFRLLFLLTFYSCRGYRDLGAIRVESFLKARADSTGSESCWFVPLRTQGYWRASYPFGHTEHRSHFGSRYTIRLKRLASLFAPRTSRRFKSHQRPFWFFAPASRAQGPRGRLEPMGASTVTPSWN